jgi:hypothetical protein
MYGDKRHPSTQNKIRLNLQTDTENNSQKMPFDHSNPSENTSSATPKSSSNGVL